MEQHHCHTDIPHPHTKTGSCDKTAKQKLNSTVSADEVQRAINRQTPQRHVAQHRRLSSGDSAFKLKETSQSFEKTNVHLLDGLRG